MSEAILVEGLTKAYHGKTVVDHLNLSVKSGTVFGLLGANGAGKSTTIECILGTKQADAGTVRLLGQDPKKCRRALFQRIGVQFQEGDYQKEMLIFSGTTLPIEVMPLGMRKIVSLFPLTQGITMMKNAFLGINAGSILLPVCVMLGLTALCVGLAIRFFCWE